MLHPLRSLFNRGKLIIQLVATTMEQLDHALLPLKAAVQSKMHRPKETAGNNGNVITDICTHAHNKSRIRVSACLYIAAKPNRPQIVVHIGSSDREETSTCKWFQTKPHGHGVGAAHSRIWRHLESLGTISR